MDEPIEAGPVVDAPDTQAEAPDAPVEQGTSVDPAPEAEAQDEGGYLRHADYTRKTMELAEQRRAFEAERQALAEHQQLLDRINQDPHLKQQLDAYWSDEAPTDDEFVDPYEQKLTEIEQRQAALEQREHFQAQQAADMQALQQDLDEITRQRGGKLLTEDELMMLGQFAGRDEQGRLSVLPAWHAMEGLFEARRQEWITGKTAAPSPPGTGGPGSQKFDFNNEEERLASMEAIVQSRWDS